MFKFLQRIRAVNSSVTLLHAKRKSQRRFFFAALREVLICILVFPLLTLYEILVSLGKSVKSFKIPVQIASTSAIIPHTPEFFMIMQNDGLLLNHMFGK